MDSDNFRRPTFPFMYEEPNVTLVETRATQAVLPQEKFTGPTEDSRYPGWAAPMQDGRLITDYRPQCELNIPVGTQSATRNWMQKNAKRLIDESRKRNVVVTGAGQPYESSTVMPSYAFVSCDINRCVFSPAEKRGVGIERQESVPPLFGTFAPSQPSSGHSEVSYGTSTNLTTMYEGGRNTIRGKY